MAKRQPINLPRPIYEEGCRLRDELTEKRGFQVSLVETVHRAFACLRDAHSRGAWLSPREAAPLMEQRTHDRMASVVAQLLRQVVPERKLEAITFDPEAERMTVYFSEDTKEPVWLFTGGAERTPPHPGRDTVRDPVDEMDKGG